MSEINSRVCNKCKKIKPFICFSNKKGGKYGLSSICKDCINEYSRKHYYDNKYSRSESLSKYRENNKNKIKKYYQKNREKLKEMSRINYHENKESRSNQRKCRYIENKEELKLKKKKYYNKNRERLSEKRKISMRKKLSIDSDFRIKTTIRDRFKAEIKSKYPNRSWRVMFNLTGYSAKCYIDHFNKTQRHLFERYKKTSEYHIDHIIPISIYNFENKRDIEKCWNPRNLRITTAKENIKKSNKVIPDLIEKYEIKDLLPEEFKIV